MPATRDAYLAIFDHDGVLVDSLEFHQEAWFEMGTTNRIELHSGVHPRDLRNDQPEYLPTACSAIRSRPNNYSAIRISRKSAIATWHGVKIQLMDGVRAVLDSLTAHGVKLAIGSSGVRPNLDLTVKECGLDGRFAAIASLEDITRGKPDPQVFLVAAAKADAPPGPIGCLRGCPGRNPGRQGRRHVRRRPDHDPPCRRARRTPGPTKSSKTSPATTSPGLLERLKSRTDG